MREIIRRLLCISFLLVVSTTGAIAQKRVALVIGNSTYSSVPKLKNPANDATALATQLRAIGYDRVVLKLDLTGNDLRTALAGFAREAAGADIAIVYFAGHGIEVGGTNYIVPTDAKLAHVDDVDFEAIDLGKVIRALNRVSGLKLIILDACRNNPFRSSMAGLGTTRSVGRGLARVTPSTNNMLVAYAAKENTIAADGRGRHSPYATALLKHIATPNVDVRLLFGRVRDDVLKLTGGRQEPFTYGSLSGQELPLSRKTTRTSDGKLDDAQREIFKLALAANRDKRYEEAARLYKKLVQWGSRAAMVNLGNLYRIGNGVKKDYGEAVRLYARAASGRGGIPLASLLLARMHKFGIGVPKDTQKALYHYHMSAYQIAIGLKTRPDDWISEFKRRPNFWDLPVRKELQETLMEEGVFSGRADGALGEDFFQAIRDYAESW